MLKLHFSFKSHAFYSMNFQGKALCLKGKQQAFYLVYSNLVVSGFWVWGPPILRCSILMKPSNPLSMEKGDVSQSSGYFGLIGGSARTTSCFFFFFHLTCLVAQRMTWWDQKPKHSERSGTGVPIKRISMPRLHNKAKEPRISHDTGGQSRGLERPRVWWIGSTRSPIIDHQTHMQLTRSFNSQEQKFHHTNVKPSGKVRRW